MTYFDSIDSTGYSLAITLPGTCIDDCSTPGQDASDSVKYWIRKLGFNAPEEGTRDYLRGFGSWDASELRDHDANLERLLWLVCGDERERYTK